MRNTLDFKSRIFGPKIYLWVTSKKGCVIYVHKYPRFVYLCVFSLSLCIVSFFVPLFCLRSHFGQTAVFTTFLLVLFYESFVLTFQILCVSYFMFVTVFHLFVFLISLQVPKSLNGSDIFVPFFITSQYFFLIHIHFTPSISILPFLTFCITSQTLTDSNFTSH